jgi:hypothetical protein
MKQKLLHFFFELCEQGMKVSTPMVVLQAALLSRKFYEKTTSSYYQIS